LKPVGCAENNMMFRRPSQEGRGLKLKADGKTTHYMRRPSQEGRGLKLRCSLLYNFALYRRPSQEGRGLKPVCIFKIIFAYSRPSQEGRGLKLFARCCLDYCLTSPLARGAWIETFRLHQIILGI